MCSGPGASLTFLTRWRRPASSTLLPTSPVFRGGVGGAREHILWRGAGRTSLSFSCVRVRPACPSGAVRVSSCRNYCVAPGRRARFRERSRTSARAVGRGHCETLGRCVCLCLLDAACLRLRFGFIRRCVPWLRAGATAGTRARRAPPSKGRALTTAWATAHITFSETRSRLYELNGKGPKG